MNDIEATALNTMNAAMQETLTKAGIHYEEIKVFGRIRSHIHVVCESRDSAAKWASLIAKVTGNKVSVSATSWEPKSPRGDFLNRTLRNGFLIASHI